MGTGFSDVLREKRAWYGALEPVYCPLLNEWVIFNAKGFRHLLYDSHGKARNAKEQFNRLNLLPLVIPVLRNATSVYDHKRIFSKKLGTDQEIWELRYRVGKRNTRVSVVLRRIGDGNITFFSVWNKY